MTLPPIHNPHNLGAQAQQAQEMAKNCKNERLAITLQCVAIGSMIVMAAASTAHLIKDLFRHSERHDRSR
jgi:hypothetical protein